MTKVEYVNALGKTIIESLDYALSYASMAYDACGFVPVIKDMDGNVIEYHFDSRGNALLGN